MNNVQVSGKLVRKKVGESQYGKWAFFTLEELTEVKGKEYKNYIPCSANKMIAQIVEGIEDGAEIVVMGKVKTSKNKKTEQWNTMVQASEVYANKSAESAQPEPQPSEPEISIEDMPF